MAKKNVVEISAQAERDAARIFESIRADAPRAAAKWLAALKRQQSLLSRFPRRGSIIPEAIDLGVEYRHLLFGAYRTIYRVEEARVVVVRVIDGVQLLNTASNR